MFATPMACFAAQVSVSVTVQRVKDCVPRENVSLVEIRLPREENAVSTAQHRLALNELPKSCDRDQFKSCKGTIKALPEPQSQRQYPSRVRTHRRPLLAPEASINYHYNRFHRMPYPRLT